MKLANILIKTTQTRVILNDYSEVESIMNACDQLATDKTETSWTFEDGSKLHLDDTIHYVFTAE